MKSYGLDLQHSDINSRASEILSGTSFPLEVQPGSVFYLTQAIDGFEVGEYMYDGSTWVPDGDITEVIAGDGLLGGGAAGVVTLGLNRDVVKQIVQEVIAQDPIDPIAMSLIFGS